MTIEEIIEQRRIVEVVHFTTHRGLLGTLHSRALKSRKRIPSDVDLKLLFRANADIRKDVAWLDYVNLSISRINSDYFRRSVRWHREEDLWWCITSFDPIILAHQGVHFATTNNIYTGVRRTSGAEGLEQLFAPRVCRWQGNWVNRPASEKTYHTTCEFAEVLYPAEVSTNHLRRVYVTQGEDQDEVYAQLRMTGIDGIEVIVDSTRFGSWQ